MRQLGKLLDKQVWAQFLLPKQKLGPEVKEMQITIIARSEKYTFVQVMSLHHYDPRSQVSRIALAGCSLRETNMYVGRFASDLV